MTKTLVISRVFPPQVGGSGRFLWEIYRRQPAGECCVVAGDYAGSQAFDAASPLPIRRMPLHVTNWGLLPWGFPNYFANYRPLRALVRRDRIATVHAATLFPEGMLARMLYCTVHTPYLCFVHGEEVPVASGSRELSYWAGQILTRAGRVIANSENTRRMILEHWPNVGEKTVVITPGVDIDRFHPAPSSAAIRARLGWGKRPVVLTAGRLQERKGHDQLLRALRAVRQVVPNVLYAIAGDGDRRPFLNSLVAELQLGDCVQFLGELTDDALIECYQQCDLLALPNREVNGDFEGFGMVLVEAQACGRPVLAGTSGGTAETMRVGETGRLVDCERPEPLAKALIELLVRPERLHQMGVLGRQWVVERFDWNVLGEKARRVFSELGGKSGGSLPFVNEPGATQLSHPAVGADSRS